MSTDGGTGPLIFVLTPELVIPVDPVTGTAVGTPFALGEAPPHGEWWLDISEAEDGRHVVVSWWDLGAAQMITAVFDLETGEEIARGLYGDTASIAMPDGTIVSVSSAALTRSSMALEPLGSLPKAQIGGNALRASDDGRLLVATGQGHNALLYDAEAGAQLGEEIPIAGTDWIGAHIHPAGTHLVTNGADGVVLWNLDPGHHFGVVCDIAGRELTSAEWRTYFGAEPQTTTCADAAG